MLVVVVVDWEDGGSIERTMRGLKPHPGAFGGMKDEHGG